ncbi:MAG: glycosyltransferase family 2 protein [Bacteroidota bacterium]
MKKLITVIIPVYNEELNIENAYTEIVKLFNTLRNYDYEIIFTDNCSQDNSRSILKKIAKKDKKVTVLLMSRNFTSEYSSQAAMMQAQGDAVTIVDCDLQDPPEVIPIFIREWEKGSQVVIGVRNKIQDTLLMRIVRKSFYKIFNKLANINMPLNAGSFCLLDRKVLNVINDLPERNRFFRGLRAWAGFSVKEVIYERKARRYGNSKNNLLDYIKDSQRGILGFSFVPLDVMTTLGFMLVIVSFIFLLFYLITVFLIGNPVNASIPLLTAIIFFGGIQMLGISILGKYIQIIFEEVKDRPTYVIDEILNDHKKRLNIQV